MHRNTTQYRGRSWRTPALILLILFVLLGDDPASAHFRLNANIRIFHVDYLDKGVRLLIRLPMPLLVANSAQDSYPYTFDVLENDRLMHYLDADAVNRDPEGIGQLLADGHRLWINGAVVEPRIEAVRVYPAARQPRFSSLAEAQTALRSTPLDLRLDPPYSGDTVVDAALFYPYDEAINSLAIASVLQPGLPGEDQLANLILDYRNGEPRIYRLVGLLNNPVVLARTWFDAALSFVKAGAEHILEGIDHLLFVLCLSIGAATLGQLAWRVTGFTLGHSITLILGFFGYVPSGNWFIPTVETLIALSIIYAGAVAILRLPGAATFGVTVLIGLLHGLGFSFVLREILQFDAAHIGVSLVSFNLGVEIGQLAVIGTVWPGLYWLGRRRPQFERMGRVAIAMPCIAIAALWTGERLGVLLQTVVRG